MEVIVNGQRQVFEQPLFMADVLETLGVNAEHVAVELNGAVLPHADFAGKRLAPGDVIEVVRFVCGG